MAWKTEMVTSLSASLMEGLLISWSSRKSGVILCLGIIVYFLTEHSAALIPRECRHNLTKHDATCCPIPSGKTEPCGGPGFGLCLKYQVYHDPLQSLLPREVLVDDRIEWPTRLFKYGCHCDGNRWGYACHECWYGWTGKDCSVRQISVRRNILSYTAHERKIFRKVMVMSHNLPSQEYVIFEEKYNNRSDPLVRPQFMLDASLHQVLIYIHRYASRSTLFNTAKQCDKIINFDMNHRGVGFVTWHRFFMMFWERQVAKMAKKEMGIEDFRFPYWDWTDAKSCEVCTPDLLGDLSNPRDPKNASPFRGWRNYCGAPQQVACAGCHTRLQRDNYEILRRRWRPDAKFPSTAQVEFTLSRPMYFDYSPEVCRSFATALEGSCVAPGSKDKYSMHNGVHNSVDGPFSTSAGSTNDPLFPLHHTQIDRIFSAWYRRHQPHIHAMPNRYVEYGHCRDCNLAAFIPPLPHYYMLADTRALGYEYDSMKFGKKMAKSHSIP